LFAKTRKLSYHNDERAMLSVQLVSNLHSPDPPTLPSANYPQVHKSAFYPYPWAPSYATDMHS